MKSYMDVKRDILLEATIAEAADEGTDVQVHGVDVRVKTRFA